MRVQANALASKMNQIESALMTAIWHTVLERFNITSLSLQKNGIDLLTAVQLFKSLLEFTAALRETFDNIEETAKEFVADAEYKENTKHKQRRKTFFDEADRLTSGCVTDSTRAISNFFLQRGSRLVGS